MHKTVVRCRRASAACAAVAAAAFAAPAQAEPLVGLFGIGGRTLATFDSTTPGNVTAIGVTGLVSSAERLVGIDLRPSTGMLYAVSDDGNLYILNSTTGVASSIGSVSVPLSRLAFGIDFDPVADLMGTASLRITSINGQNLSVDVNPGMIGVATVDGGFSFNGVPEGFASVAYSNNDADPGTGTVLFGIVNVTRGRADLYRQIDPGAGTLSFVGQLGVSTGGDGTGFDVSGFSGTSFLALFGGTREKNGSFLFSVDLATGAATPIGKIGTFEDATFRDVYGLTAALGPAAAAIPEPRIHVLILMGLVSVAWVARSRRTAGR